MQEPVPPISLMSAEANRLDQEAMSSIDTFLERFYLHLIEAEGLMCLIKKTLSTRV